MGEGAPRPLAARPTPPPAERPVSTRATPESMVPDGIGYHSRSIKSLGPFAALGPMAIFGLLSSLFLWGSQSTLRGVIGFVLAILSCPTLPLFGFPVSSRGTMWIAVLISSAALWIAIGTLAARRATSRAVAGWREWRREWLRLAIGLWIGAFAGLAIAAILLTVDF